MLGDFILFQKFEDFTKYLFPIIDKFPNREKFALCTVIKNHCYNMIKDIIDVHRAKSKYPLLYKLDGELEFLRWLVRHSQDRGFLAHQSVEPSPLKVDEVGRIDGRLQNQTTRGGRR